MLPRRLGQADISDRLDHIELETALGGTLPIPDAFDPFLESRHSAATRTPDSFEVRRCVGGVEELEVPEVLGDAFE